MKKAAFYMAVLVMGTGLLSGCNPKETPKAEAGTYYTCPMHPEIKKDKPGTCPICGMDLVKKEN